VLENTQQPEILAFQITTTGRAAFSQAFDGYQPAQRLAVDLHNAYRFCW
jgi:hypothetical protein